MSKMLCPQCESPIPQENINQTSGLSKCEQCGSIQYIIDLQKNNQGNHEQGNANMELPSAGRSQVIKEDKDYVQIFLPKAGFGCMEKGIMIFLMIFMGIGVSIAADSGALFSLKGDFLFWIFILVPLVVLYKNLNNILRTETLEIGNYEITLTKTRPLLGTTTKVYQMNTLQGAEFEVYRKRSRKFSRINLISANGKINFFKSENDLGKKGLAGYLDQVIKRQWK